MAQGNIWLPIVWDTTNYPVSGSNALGDQARAFQQNDRLVLNSNWVNDYDFGNWGSIIANAGVYYEFERLAKKVASNTLGQRDNAQHLMAIFAEGEYHINDSISTNLGLRLNYNTRNNLISPNPRFYLNYNPALNLSWLDSITFKAGIASGFRSPNMTYLYEGFTINSSGNTNTYNYGNANLRPESSWNYELGVIADSKYFFLTATGFYTQFIDAITSNSYTQNTTMSNGETCPAGATSCNLYVNVDSAMSARLELSANMKRVMGIGFDTSYTFLHDDKGAALNLVPAHTLTMKLSYKLNNFDIYLRYISKYMGKYMTP